MKREWLIDQLRSHRGLIFRWERYKQRSADWDHDHCRGCWARFAERPDEWRGEVCTEGWMTLWPLGDTKQEPEIISSARAAGATVVPSPKVNGFQLDWICPECFEACRQDLGFIVDPDHEQWRKAEL